MRRYKLESSVAGVLLEVLWVAAWFCHHAKLYHLENWLGKVPAARLSAWHTRKSRKMRGALV